MSYYFNPPPAIEKVGRKLVGVPASKFEDLIAQVVEGECLMLYLDRGPFTQVAQAYSKREYQEFQQQFGIYVKVLGFYALDPGKVPDTLLAPQQRH